MKFSRGDQVVYTPMHAEGDPNHPDREFGFVTSVREDSHGNTIVFCRYWSKFNPSELRTKANSEGTPVDMLQHAHFVPQAVVRRALEEYCNE